MTLFVTWALVRVRMMFLATAPAPLTATPATPAPPMDTDTAVEIAWIVALFSANSFILPTVVVTVSSVLRIYASISLLIWFSARDTPIDTATPAVPPKAAAMDAAPATEWMDELSLAVRVTLPALIPLLASTPVASSSSPLIKAFTSVEILLLADTPAPLTPTPAVPLAATAAEPASTMASIFSSATASRVRLPVAVILELRT